MKTKLLLAILILASITTYSQTSIPGGYVSGTWTLSGSPYLIQGSIMVPDDSTLTIQPGVTVNFQGHYKLLVSGRLLAVGNATDSIFFTAANTTAGWYGIRFDNTPSTNDTSKISFCHLQWGRAYGSSIVDSRGGSIMLNSFHKVVISNCLIKNSSSTNGGAIFCNYSWPIITHNTITQSNIGISLSMSSPQILNNIITYNTGQGIYIEGGDWNLRIYDNIISHNAAEGISGGAGAKINHNFISYNNITNIAYTGGISGGGYGTEITNNIISNNSGLLTGGLSLSGYSLIISNNIISNNVGSSAGGIFNGGYPGGWGGPAKNIISNNLIINNTATDSLTGVGGILCQYTDASVKLINNTIANNSATFGGGLGCYFESNPSVINCIFYENEGNQIYLEDESSDPNFSYCDIQGGESAFGMNGNFYTGTYSNNIDSNPFFVSPSGGSGTGFDGLSADWSIQAGSPCVNSGNSSNLPNLYFYFDLAGSPRINGTTIDIGAYEYQDPLGISKADEKNEISIYPNPFKNSTTLQFKTYVNNAELNIYNVYGQKMKTINDVSGSQIKIERDNLPSGIYFVRLTQNNKLIALEKLIITD